MEVPFIKMHGLGNNYIFLDLIKNNLANLDFRDLARKISNVNTGIGSDGLILIHPSESSEVGMRIFNKDGSEGMNCGNGLRCTAKYVYETGVVLTPTFEIETKGGVVQAEVDVTNEGKVDVVTINMGVPSLGRHTIPMLGDEADSVINEVFMINHHIVYLTCVSMGNPHAVIFVDHIEDAKTLELGPLIEKDYRFPEGVNVEFIEVVNEQELNMRVWERGSGITQACGTGACASVVAATLNNRIKRNQNIIVHLDGGDLTVRWDESNRVWMTGAAEAIAMGTYYYRNR